MPHAGLHVGGFRNNSQCSLCPDIFLSPPTGSQQDLPQQITPKVISSHTQDIVKDNATFSYTLSCFSHFILFQSLV